MLLDGAEGHHAADVLRVRVGEVIGVGDGAGLVAKSRVTRVGAGQVSAVVLGHHREAEPAPRLVVVQALLKGDDASRAVQVLTEVGVDVIVPWAAQRCVARWTERSAERWSAWALAAAKQARRPRLPLVGPPLDLAGVAGLLRTAELPVVLHESGDEPVAGVRVPGSGDVVIVVGPEGGLSDEERGELDCPTYRLGPSVLRGATAAAVAAAVILGRSGRWSALPLPWFAGPGTADARGSGAGSGQP